MMTMKFDMHVHSSFSPDGKASPRDILAHARDIGLEGLSITDHNTLAGSREAVRLAGDYGLILVRGMEVSTSRGHMLAYGIDREIPRDLEPTETVSRIREQGGIAVVAHPYRPWSGMGTQGARTARADALEVLNAHSTPKENARARKLCREMKLPMTGGSDSHTLSSLGRAFTIIQDAETEDDVLEALRRSRTAVNGRSRSGIGALRDRTETVVRWVGRGFRRM